MKFNEIIPQWGTTNFMKLEKNELIGTFIQPKTKTLPKKFFHYLFEGNNTYWV